MQFLRDLYRSFRPPPERVVEEGVVRTTQTLTSVMGSTGGRESFSPDSEQLVTFRLMAGITSSHALNPPRSALLNPFGRPAPNLGIYARVVHRERMAKRGYKFSYVIINSCLGLQIIVAAALTAMGAANSNHVAITAFGAINTVMAGLLTFLKGSGLPNRQKYYESEWKKVREYIEQRERDFSHPGCKDDVHQVIAIIEAMYEEVKTDVETNTPDSYHSVGDIKNRSGTTNPAAPRLSSLFSQFSHGTGSHTSKLRELETRYGPKVQQFTSEIGNRIRTMEHELERDLEKEVESRRETVSELRKDARASQQQVEDAKRDVEDYARRRLDHLIGEVPPITISIGHHGEDTKARA